MPGKVRNCFGDQLEPLYLDQARRWLRTAIGNPELLYPVVFSARISSWLSAFSTQTESARLGA